MSLSLTATGVQIHDRTTGADYGVHDACLTILQEMAPDAFDPFTGGYAIIGPIFGDFDCALGTCTA